jgi:hypothetical protein
VQHPCMRAPPPGLHLRHHLAQQSLQAAAAATKLVKFIAQPQVLLLPLAAVNFIQVRQRRWSMRGG